MFYYLNGTVALLQPNLCVLDVNGVGYAVTVSLGTLGRLESGKTAKLYTYLQTGESGVELFGFADPGEKRCFELLISVSGVGPKAAISILSAVSPADLAMAVVTENEKALTAAKGIGKKIAQRIILELRDKVAKDSTIPSSGVSIAAPNQGGKLAEVTEALTVLGYTPQEISAVLRDPQAAQMSTEEIIRLALKNSLRQER